MNEKLISCENASSLFLSRWDSRTQSFAIETAFKSYVGSLSSPVGVTPRGGSVPSFVPKKKSTSVVVVGSRKKRNRVANNPRPWNPLAAPLHFITLCSHENANLHTYSRSKSYLVGKMKTVRDTDSRVRPIQSHISIRTSIRCSLRCRCKKKKKKT